MAVLAAVPGDVIEGVEGGGQAGDQIARDVARLEYVELLQTNGGGLEVVGRRAAVRVDLVNRQIGLVAVGLGDLIQGVVQLAGLLGRQRLGAGSLAVVPPIDLGVGVP